MLRSLKPLCFLTTCCGFVLLGLAVLAIPPSLVRANDPSQAAVLTPDLTCYWFYSPPCITTVDPCAVIFKICTGPIGGDCHCAY